MLDGSTGVGRGLRPNENTVLSGVIGWGFEFGSKQVHALITLPLSKAAGKSGTLPISKSRRKLGPLGGGTTSYWGHFLPLINQEQKSLAVTSSWIKDRRTASEVQVAGGKCAQRETSHRMLVSVNPRGPPAREPGIGAGTAAGGFRLEKDDDWVSPSGSVGEVDVRVDDDNNEVDVRVDDNNELGVRVDDNNEDKVESVVTDSSELAGRPAAASGTTEGAPATMMKGIDVT